MWADAYNGGMIRTSHRRCICCGRPATWKALDRPGRDGQRRLIPLCSRCPSPLEIDARAKVIAWSWSETERYSRHYGILARHVDGHRAVRLDVCELVCD